jgi:hypothetical protein
MATGPDQRAAARSSSSPARAGGNEAAPTGSTLVVVSMTVEVPEPLAGRLAAEAARRGVDPADLAVEAIEGRYGRAIPAADSPEARTALEAFIGCADSGDPDWASRNIHELRAEAAARKLAQGA